jgi:hypothetical protein
LRIIGPRERGLKKGYVLGRDVKYMDRQNCSHKSGKEAIGLDESVMCVTMPFE